MRIRHKTNFSSVEDACLKIAEEVRCFVAEREWNSAGARYQIFRDGVSSSWWRQFSGKVDETGEFPPSEVSAAARDAAEYLRDHLLQTTGHRIYGLSFTLFPDMKCRIAYDYNPPEGFDETDDTLTLEDAVDRLQKMGVEVDVSDQKS